MGCRAHSGAVECQGTETDDCHNTPLRAALVVKECVGLVAPHTGMR